MLFSLFIAFLTLLTAFLFYAGQKKVIELAKHRTVSGGKGQYNGYGLKALPGFYGLRAAYLVFFPAFLCLLLWKIIAPHIENMILDWKSDAYLNSSEPGILFRFQAEVRQGAEAILTQNASLSDFQPPVKDAIEALLAYKLFDGLWLFAILSAIALLFAFYAYRSSRTELQARHVVQNWNSIIMFAASTAAILITAGIVGSLITQAIKFFQLYNISDFLFGLRWVPKTLEHGGSYGVVPLILGTLLVSLIAMCVAIPIGLLSAIYLCEYASPNRRAFFKPILEILAGIPTVVYGLFGALTFAPLIKSILEFPFIFKIINALYGLFGASLSSLPIGFALPAGIVMGIMIIPFVASMSDDALRSVPSALRFAAYGLGSTRSETIVKVLIPAALPGISGGILLAVSRAIGETMIVVMMLGTFAYLNFNPLEPVSTFTVQINALLTGDNDFASAPVLSAFAIGLLLFVVTLALNTIALYIVRHFREIYD